MSKFFTIHTEKEQHIFNAEHIAHVEFHERTVTIELISGSKITLRNGKTIKEFYASQFIEAYEQAMKHC